MITLIACSSTLAKIQFLSFLELYGVVVKSEICDDD